MRNIGLLLFLIILSVGQIIAQPKNETGKMLRHVVLFSFKEGSTAAQIKTVTDAFGALPKKSAKSRHLNGAPTTVLKTFTRDLPIVFL